MVWRIIADIALFLAVFWMPYWWLTVILAVIFIFLFPRYWEAAVAGFFIDSLYGGWLFTVGFLIAVFLIEKIKKQLFFYNV